MKKILLISSVFFLLIIWRYSPEKTTEQPRTDKPTEATSEDAYLPNLNTTTTPSSTTTLLTPTQSTKPKSPTETPTAPTEATTTPVTNPTTPTVSPTAPQIAGCPVFPSDNPWNRNVSKDPVDPNSDNYIASIGLAGRLHADFGGNGSYGIPFVVVDQNQTKVPINFTDYGDESDPGPYPIPANAPIEGGASSDGDRHVLVIDRATCMLYELYNAFYRGPGWDASSGAVFNLRSNALRPEGWTSADAAGLPIFPGLARYEEVAQGKMNHALRFTVSRSQKAYIHPATHYASSRTDPNLPPMGLRLRLKANFDTSVFTGQSRVILETLKNYGMILADNGSNWYITGASDTRWNDDDLNQLKTVPGSAFEVVKSGTIIR